MAYRWWLGITFLNVLLMGWLALRHWPKPFGIYMGWTALMALGQQSRSWDEWAEATTVVATGWWLWHEMPPDRHGRQFVLGIGAMIVATLFYTVPMPWPHYSRVLYFTRLYSTAGFFAVSVAITAWHWANADPPGFWRVLAIPWFASVLLAGAQRGWPRWAVAIGANFIWSACLLGWLQYGRRKPAKVRSMIAS